MAKKTKTAIPLTPVYFDPARHMPLIKMLARQGMLLDKIAEQIGITTRDLGVWRSRHPIIGEAITDGHAVAQAVVENALYESALGLGMIVKTKHKTGHDKNGDPISEDTTIVEQRVPNVTAQIFILKNLDPEHWKDKHEIETTKDLTIIWEETRQELPAPAETKPDGAE